MHICLWLEQNDAKYIALLQIYLIIYQYKYIMKTITESTNDMNI